MKVSEAKFKATCLGLMDRVATTGEEVVITKHGVPVAKLVAANRRTRAPRSVHGCMKGTNLVLGASRRAAFGWRALERRWR